MEKTIKVTGKGKLSVKPDRIRLMITQTDVLATYREAIKGSADRKAVLNRSMRQMGFREEDLKTLNFNVETEYESYQAKDKSWKRRLLGYRYTHRMKLELSNDNALLGKALMAVSRCPGRPEFNIQYTISDSEAAKNELLRRAVMDSKTKAAVLSEAAGMHLGEIL